MIVGGCIWTIMGLSFYMMQLNCLVLKRILFLNMVLWCFWSLRWLLWVHDFIIGDAAGYFNFSASRNRYDKTKFSGGSSGGSAGVVAAGLCPAALGVDGGGIPPIRFLFWLFYKHYENDIIVNITIMILCSLWNCIKRSKSFEDFSPGSVRMPSALCGIVGFKATFGRVSPSGWVQFNFPNWN